MSVGSVPAFAWGYPQGLQWKPEARGGRGGLLTFLVDVQGPRALVMCEQRTVFGYYQGLTEASKGWSPPGRVHLPRLGSCWAGLSLGHKRTAARGLEMIVSGTFQLLA